MPRPSGPPLTAAEVMMPEPSRSTTPDVVRRYRNAQSADVGERSRPVHSPPLQAGAVYGIRTNKSDSAAPLINPPKLSAFEEARIKAQQPELKSTSLARDHVAKLIASGAVFGEASQNMDGTAADCIRPQVSSNDLEAEETARTTLYVKSHGSYLAGEQKTHGTGVIDPNMAHGVRTPMDSTGAGARNALRWSSPAEPARVVSSRQREFADGPARPAVVDDPNTVFGVVTAVDGDTVGSLIKPSVADADATTDLRNRIQAQLRPVGAASLGRFENDLFAADTAQTGAVPAALVTELCETYGMGIGSRTLRDLLQACAFGDSGNGDDSVVDCAAVMDLLRPEVGFNESTTLRSGARPCGVSTIRSDLNAPSFVSVTETRNFGDQGDAKRVLNPSLYTTRGLSERAVTGGREVEEMRKIFETAGLGATHDFDTVWGKAVDLAGGGPVSVAIFQEALM